MNQHEIQINDQCIGCGLCVSDCPAHNIRLVNGRARILAQDCIMCGHCEAICPKEAVSISGYSESSVKKEKNQRLDPSAVLEVIRFRRSIRQFKEKEIPSAVLDQILEAGRLTHTGKNAQDVSFIVLDKQKAEIEAIAVSMLRRIKPLINLVSPLARRREINDHFFFFQAPKVIIVCAKDQVNAILAAQNMEFVAEAHGLGVLYSGFFITAVGMSRRIRQKLGLSRDKKAYAALVLGYPKINYMRSPKRERLDVSYL